MNQGRGEAVILDANVIYPAPLRDFLLHAATMKLYRPLWSQDIQEEWVRNLLRNRPDLSEKQLQRTVVAMNTAFPDAIVTNHKPLVSKLLLPDPDDRHVLAAAIKGKASIIATANLRDFPAHILRPYGLKATHPDDLILDFIARDSPGMKEALLNQVNSMKNPPIPVEQVLRNLKENGLVQSVAKLRDLLK